MSYKIDIDALDTLYGLIYQQANDWNTQISCVHTELSTIVNTTNMTGAAADNLKDYFSSVHFSIIASLMSLIDMHLKNCLLYKDDYQTNIDTDLHATIHLEELEYFKGRVNAINELAVELDGNLASALKEVDDIFSISYDDVTAVSDAHNTVINQITTLDSDIIALEDTHVKNDFVNTEELIESLTSFISEQMANPRSYKSDFSKEGFFVSSASFSDLALSVQNVTNEAENKETDVLSAYENHKDRVELLQEEYEERVKEAQVINWVVAGTCVVLSATAIILTAGAATPVVAAVSIGTSAVSSATIAGTANLTTQYVEHGNIIENADEIDWQSFGKDVAVNAFSGAVTGAIGFGLGKGVDALGKTAWVTSKMSTVTNGYAKIAINAGTSAVTETAGGMATRFVNTAIVTGGDFEAAGKDAVDGKQILLDVAIGGTTGGVEEFTKIKNAQNVADKHVDDFNKIHKPLDKMQELGYTDLKAGKNNAVDFSNSDYILKTETGEVIEIKINATGSTKADYELAEKIVQEKYDLDLKSMRTGKNKTHSWVYLDDYNALGNEITLQFVEKDAAGDLGVRAGAQAQYHVVHGTEAYDKAAINVSYKGVEIGDAVSFSADSLNDIYKKNEDIKALQYAY